MRLTTIVVCSALLACSAAPKKPVVAVGALELVPKILVLEGLSDGSDAVHPVPMMDYDKATCFKPAAWQQEKTYIKLLENFAGVK